ncbi:hypothetical protein, partial [Stenotrophomonas sp. MA5]|uniref:hypothetical protein n=1 Tax=Stenotrophomonas sp. MA5 TaxID=2508572 RepID=UPI0019D6B510
GRAPLAAPGGADLGARVVNERARRTRGRGSSNALRKRKKAAMQGIAAFMGVCWKRISRSC